MANCNRSNIVGLLTALSLFGASTALAATASEVYIPLGSDNSIVIVDPHTNKVIGKIGKIPNAHGLAATPDGLTLIAGSYNERSVDAPAPDKPPAVTEEEHASHHAKPAKQSTNKSKTLSSLTLIRVKERSIVRRIDVPGAVHHVTVSPTGAYAIVTHPNQDAVSVIDLTTYKVAATIPTGPLPNYAVFGPDGKHAFVSNAGNNTISNIDIAKRIVLRNIPVGESPEHLVLSKDGARLYVNNINEGTVSEIDTKAGRVSKIHRVGSTLHGIDLSDDEKTLYVASLGDEKVVSINLTSGKLVAVKLSPTPYHLAAIRGLGKIFVSSVDKPIIWVLDQKSLKTVGQIEIGGKGHQMVQITRQ